MTLTISPQEAPIARRRICGPKTRTGCATCKIRRIKCDEAKPYCNRCTKTGRTCDGYTTSPSSSRSPTPDASSLAIQRLCITTPGNTQEKRGLSFFVANTAAELSGFYDTSFWGELILQASASEPSLRHSIIAIGSLHEEFSNRRPGDVDAAGSSPRSPGYQRDLESRESVFAMNQYTKALTSLRKSLESDNQPPLAALMSCILFVCFDSLRGYYNNAMVHLKSGLRILKDLKNDDRQVSKEEETMINEKVIPIFMRLTLQAIIYIDTISTNERRAFIAELTEIGMMDRAMIPANFTSLEDARMWFNHIVEGLFRSLYMCDGEIPMGFQPLETVQLCKSYAHQLGLWNKAFSAFMSRSSQSLSSKELRGAALLKIHHMTAKIMAEITPDITDLRALGQAVNDLAVFSRFTAEFATIVTLSRSLIVGAEQDTANGKPPLTFSTDLGIIGPLWYICVKCQDMGVRGDAVELLQRCERREGMWDGAAAAKMAREFWDIQSLHKSVMQSHPKSINLAAMGWFINERGEVITGVERADSVSSAGLSAASSIGALPGLYGAGMNGIVNQDTINAGTPLTNGFVEAGGGSNGSGLGDWVELVFEDGNRWEWKFRDRYAQGKRAEGVPEKVKEFCDFKGLFPGAGDW